MRTPPYKSILTSTSAGLPHLGLALYGEKDWSTNEMSKMRGLAEMCMKTDYM